MTSCDSCGEPILAHNAMEVEADDGSIATLCSDCYDALCQLQSEDADEESEEPVEVEKTVPCHNCGNTIPVPQAYAIKSKVGKKVPVCKKCLSILKQIKETEGRVCHSCKRQIRSSNDGVHRFINDKKILLCNTCNSNLDKAMHPRPEKMSYIGGFFGGVVAALFAGFLRGVYIYSSDTLFGLIEYGVGWIATKGTVYGSGSSTGRGITALCCINTLIALAFSVFIAVFIATLEYEGFAVSVVYGLFGIPYLLISSPIRLIFWLIALFPALKVSAQD